MAAYDEKAVDYPFRILIYTRFREDHIFIQSCFLPFAPPVLKNPTKNPQKTQNVLSLIPFGKELFEKHTKFTYRLADHISVIGKCFKRQSLQM